MTDETLTTHDPVDLPAETAAQRRAVFLELIAEGCNLSEAARALGVNRSTVFRWRQSDPAFARQVADAFKANVESLKREAERRAMSGSDKLLMFLLCNYAPEQFSNTQRLEHSVDGNLAERLAQGRARIAKGATPAAAPAATDDCELV